MQNNLKSIRLQIGKTQEEVASDLGVALSTYRSWEQGQRNMTGQLLIELSGYYGVTTDTILGTRYADNFDDHISRTKQEILSELQMALNSLQLNDLAFAQSLIHDFISLSGTGRSRLLETADDMIRSRKYDADSGHAL